MIKILKKKLIVAAMVAVSILLIAMFGTLNVMNYFSMNNYSDIVLERLVDVYNSNPMFSKEADIPRDENGEPLDLEEVPDTPPAGESGGESGDTESGSSVEEIAQKEPDSIEDVAPMVVHFGFIEPEVNINDILRAAYFTVSVDKEGNVGFTDVSRIADVSLKQAQYYASDLFENNRKSGWYNNCKFLRGEDVNGDYVYIFLDRQPELINLRKLLIMSLAIMLVCFGIFFLVVTLVSGKMLRPVVDNIEQQKNFITNASHEIKTPLAIIQANAEALEMFSGENKWTGNIKEQTNRLSVLMNNMLTLAKAQENISDLPKTDIDLSAFINDFLRVMHETAAKKNVIFDESIENGILVYGNRVQIGQAISIVLKNAVDYCKPDSQITVRFMSKERNAVFTIENVCEALPDCEPERLFERFFRPDISRYSDVHGNGIGLSAARTIMEAYGGSISCKYEGTDRIKFTLIFKKS